MASALASLVLAHSAAREKAVRGGVIPVIEQHLLMADQSQDRRDGMFHPSDLSKDFCPRAWVLYNHHPEGYAVKEGAISPQLNRIFGNGHGVHERIQRYLGPKLFGKWHRTMGWDAEKNEPIVETRVNAFYPGPGWTYGEVSLVHTADGVQGATDGLLDLDNCKDVLEVKSMRADQFRWLGEEPHTAHKIQVDVYLHCLEAMRQQALLQVTTMTSEFSAATKFLLKPVDGVWVVYECKDDQGLKQFYIPNDPVRVGATMNALRPRMHAARAFTATRELPVCCCPEGKKSKLCTKLKAMPFAA